MRTANRLSNWQEASVVVAGLGVSGFAAADGLMSLGAKVTVLDESEGFADKALLLETLDVTVRLGRGATGTWPSSSGLGQVAGSSGSCLPTVSAGPFTASALIDGPRCRRRPWRP